MAQTSEEILNMLKAEDDLSALLDLKGETELENLVHIVTCLSRQPNIVVFKYEIHIKMNKNDTSDPNTNDCYVIRQGDFDGESGFKFWDFSDSQTPNDVSENVVKGKTSSPLKDNRLGKYEKLDATHQAGKTASMIANSPVDVVSGFDKVCDVAQHATNDDESSCVHNELSSKHNRLASSNTQTRLSNAKKQAAEIGHDRLDMSAKERDRKKDRNDNKDPVDESLEKVGMRLQSKNGDSSSESLPGNNDLTRSHQQSGSENQGQKTYKCLHCNQSFAQLLSLQVHELCHPSSHLINPTITYTRRQKYRYRCPMCQYKNQARCHMESHLNEKHNCAKFFICKYCKFVCLISDDYETHLKSPKHEETKSSLLNEEGHHLCPVCGFRGKTATILRTHMLVHSEKKAYSCPDCSFKCKTLLRLKNHEEIHKPEKPFQCHMCTFSTHLKHHLKRHTVGHFRSQLKYKCRKCDSSFKDMNKLKDHAMFVHKSPDFYYCALCPYSGQDRKLYSEHMQLHRGKNQYACDMCDYSTHKKYQLQAHKQIHAKVKPFPCPNCEKEFAGEVALRKHMKSHESKVTQYFPCHLCSFTAKAKRLLNHHMRSHLGFNVFKCEYCDYSTKYRGNLYKHMMRHTDEKPHACNLCTFSCKLPESLRRHQIRVHKNDIMLVKAINPVNQLTVQIIS